MDGVTWADRIVAGVFAEFANLCGVVTSAGQWLGRSGPQSLTLLHDGSFVGGSGIGKLSLVKACLFDQESSD